MSLTILHGWASAFPLGLAAKHPCQHAFLRRLLLTRSKRRRGQDTLTLRSNSYIPLWAEAEAAGTAKAEVAPLAATAEGVKMEAEGVMAIAVVVVAYQLCAGVGSISILRNRYVMCCFR